MHVFQQGICRYFAKAIRLDIINSYPLCFARTWFVRRRDGARRGREKRIYCHLSKTHQCLLVWFVWTVFIEQANYLQTHFAKAFIFVARETHNWHMTHRVPIWKRSKVLLLYDIPIQRIEMLFDRSSERERERLFTQQIISEWKQ